MEILRSIVTFFGAIPDVVWAAIVASLLTLGGVLLTDRQSTKRLLIQLKHDLEQRDREREMSLRRHVYLPAAESISRTQDLLGRLVDLNIPDRELADEYRINSGALAKVQIIGNNKTVLALSSLMSEFAAAYVELSFNRICLQERKNRSELFKQFREKASVEQERWLENMKQMNLNRSSYQQRWKVIIDNFEFATKELEGYSKEERAARDDQTREHLQMFKSCIEQSSRVAKLIPPAVFAAREELELPLNEDEYMKSFDESLQRSKLALETFIQKFQHIADAQHSDASGAQPKQE